MAFSTVWLRLGPSGPLDWLVCLNICGVHCGMLLFHPPRPQKVFSSPMHISRCNHPNDSRCKCRKCRMNVSNLGHPRPLPTLSCQDTPCSYICRIRILYAHFNIQYFIYRHLCNFFLKTRNVFVIFPLASILECQFTRY